MVKKKSFFKKYFPSDDTIVRGSKRCTQITLPLGNLDHFEVYVSVHNIGKVLFTFVL